MARPSRLALRAISLPASLLAPLNSEAVARLALMELSASVIDSGCRPGGQLLQPSGQLFELLVCTEFVQAVNADLNRLGVAVGDTVDVFDVTHDRLRSNETGIRERPDVLRNATPFPNKANWQRRRWFHSPLPREEPHVRRLSENPARGLTAGGRPPRAGLGNPLGVPRGVMVSFMGGSARKSGGANKGFLRNRRAKISWRARPLMARPPAVAIQNGNSKISTVSESPNIGYNRTASDEKTDWEKSHARDRSCFAQYHSCDGDRSPRSGEGEAGAIGARRPARLSVVGATRLVPRLPSE